LDNCDCVFPPVADRPPAQTPFVAEGCERNYDVALVYLGNRKVAEDAASLRLLGCTHVVNAAPFKWRAPWRPTRKPGVQNTSTLTSTTEWKPSMRQAPALRLERALRSVLEKAMESTKYLERRVPCTAPAASLAQRAWCVLYWLITRRGLRLCAAWRTVKEARGVIGPTAAFMGLLLSQYLTQRGSSMGQRDRDNGEAHERPWSMP